MTSTNDTSHIVGHSLYLEFARSNGEIGYVTQIIITPEAVNTSGNTVPMTAYRRRLSTNATRKQWNHLRVSRSIGVVNASVPASVADRNLELTNLMLNSFWTIFDGLKKNGYSLVLQPVVVETTAVDMDDVSLGKSPYKLLGRIWKARKALGFPVEFIPEVRVHPATTVL